MQIKDNGMTFHDEAPADLAAVLEQLYQSKERIRVFYGDRVTGRVWPEEYNVLGRIGRSTGSQKCPLLINNARSRGGPALLDHCILRIDVRAGRYNPMRATAYRTIYTDPRYQEPDGHIELEDGCYAVYFNDEVAGNFKSQREAVNFSNFLFGKRWKK